MSEETKRVLVGRVARLAGPVRRYEVDLTNYIRSCPPDDPDLPRLRALADALDRFFCAIPLDPEDFPAVATDPLQQLRARRDVEG